MNNPFANTIAGVAGLNNPAPDANIANPDDFTVDRLTTKILPERWNEVHTYYFALAVANRDGSVSNNWKPPNTGFNLQNGDDDTDPAPNYKFSRKSIPLRIPPQALSMSLQFASSVVATNRGILEENNGVVFRTISISGTTGVWSARMASNQTAPLTSASFNIAAVFPGAVSAIGSLVKTAKGVFGGNVQAKKSENLLDPELQETGYHQFWALHNFFMEYAHNKKQRGANGLRLLFASPKDNLTFVVTPVSFDLRRDANDPLQYKYSITLRAWDVTSALSAPSLDLGGVPNIQDQLSVRYLAERLRRMRRALLQAGNVIKAVQSDVLEIANVVNQAVLGVKDIVGVGLDLLDFGPQLKQNIDNMILNNKAQWAQLMSEHASNKPKSPSLSLFLTGANPIAGAGLASIGAATSHASPTNSNQVLSSTISASGKATTDFNSAPTGESPSQDLTDAAGSKAIGDFLNDPDLAEGSTLSQLQPLSEALTKAIADSIQESQEITASDIFDLAGKLKEVSENISYSTGMMDPTYAAMYGLPAPTVTDRTPTEADIILGAQIEDGRDAFIGSLATGTIYGERKDNPFNTANNALPEGSKLPTPASGIPVFVQRDASLDEIAKRYLGDANRAREIAILNDLRAPYIDEAGFSIPLFLAAGRSFVVNDRTKLVTNQIVKISANGLPTVRRSILSIDDIGGGQFKVTVNGQPNLSAYIASRAPRINARIPGTVGSGDTILIPNAGPSDDIISVRSTSLSEQLTHAEQTFRVDMALSENGDLAIGADGDFSRSYGYQNAVQAIRLKLETETGELEQHPEFGIDAAIGNTLSGGLVSQISDSVQNAVLTDTRFQNADVNADLDGTALRIRVDAKGANGTGLIAVEYKVNT